MLIVETVVRIRREHAAGKAIKAIARDLRLSRKVVRKAIRSPEAAFNYQRKVQPLPRIGPYQDRLDALLEENEGRGRRDRLRMTRIHDLLVREGFDGSYDAVRRYAARWRAARRKDAGEGAPAFIPMTFQPGEAYQFDWSHEDVEIAGKPMRVKVAHKAAIGQAEFAAIVAKFPNAKVDENIEKLLSLCKVYLELNEAADDNDEGVTAVRAFVTQSEASILTQVDFVGPETALPAHEAYVRKIGRRGFRKARAKLFTTNYDLTIEEAARRLRFTIIDGFSHSLDQVYDRQHFELDIVRREAGKEAPDYIPNVFQLYKLHGSADWRRIGAEVVRSRNNATGQPVLIYPRSSKYQEAFDPPYLDMMGAFQAALREPDTALVIAGFGFKDDHISRPVMSALESNLTLRLVICDPSFILSEEALRGVAPEPPAHAIPADTAHDNPFLAKIAALAARGDPRIHLINGRFEDLADALPDLMGETDRERHVERVKVLREPGA